MVKISGEKGENNIFSNKFEISGLLVTWMLFRGTLQICFSVKRWKCLGTSPNLLSAEVSRL